MYDEWLEKSLTGEWIIINDLLLDYNNNVFQIDSLLVSSKKIYLFNVKNYEGDFYIEGNRWYSPSGSEIKDPLLQLNRSESLLRQFLVELGFTPQIDSLLIFINPEFHMYQAPLNLPAIFPAQLNRFMDKLNKSTSKTKSRDLKLAKLLLASHIKDSPYSRLPEYSYDKLKKGITCAACNSFLSGLSNDTLVCTNCGFVESVNSAVARSVMEYQLLFPESKLTTNTIYEWCKVIPSKRAIKRVLLKEYKLMGHGKASYYVKS